MKMLFPSMLFIVLCVRIVAAITIYHVTADGSGTESLQYYLNNTSKYLLSNSQLLFEPGEYYLDVDLIIKNVNQISLICKRSCKINCTLFTSIMILNVTNFSNIGFKNCNKNQSAYLHTTFDYGHVSIRNNASIFFI